MIEKIEAPALTEQIADRLADEIIHGRLVGGSRVAEQEWARQLGVSRGSLREALLLLERRHLVRIEPRRGARVVAMSEQWTREIAQAWFLILRAVVAWLGEHGEGRHRPLFEQAIRKLERLAAQDDLEAFYEASMQLALDATASTGHRVYTEMMRNLMPAARRCFHFALCHSPGQTASTVEFVSALAAALDAGDRERAARVIHEFEELEVARIAIGLADLKDRDSDTED